MKGIAGAFWTLLTGSEPGRLLEMHFCASTRFRSDRLSSGDFDGIERIKNEELRMQNVGMPSAWLVFKYNLSGFLGEGQNVDKVCSIIGGQHGDFATDSRNRRFRRFTRIFSF
ncbi:MAG: hypothetical protein JW776_04515 [Candidatus Lokiarchaeota archaeon]|nr:hypothetical protein [Candidatus Lokiarchaeota archaeon]